MVITVHIVAFHALALFNLGRTFSRSLLVAHDKHEQEKQTKFNYIE